MIVSTTRASKHLSNIESVSVSPLLYTKVCKYITARTSHTNVFFLLFQNKTSKNIQHLTRYLEVKVIQSVQMSVNEHSWDDSKWRHHTFRFYSITWTVTVAACPIPNLTKTPPPKKNIYGKNENKNETTSKIKPSQQWWSTSSALMPFNNQPTFWQTSDRIWAKYGSHWWISCGSSHDTHSSGFNIETSNSHTFCKGHWSISPLLKYMDHPMLHSHLSENLAMS